MLDAISQQLFWDCDLAKLDEEQHKNFIIVRVMEKGGMNDVKEVWNFYSQEDIKAALTCARTLTTKTISFFANQFGVEKDDFRAYRRKRQEQLTWP